MSAMPTGSLAPDSPSRIVPLRPAISLPPSTENTTAGSVGAIAVATRRQANHGNPNTRCRTTAAAAAVTNVPASPVIVIDATADRKRRQPMRIPPSNRMKIRATLTTRSTVLSGGAWSPGTSWTASADATSISAGTGTFSRAVSRLDRTAARTTRAASTRSNASSGTTDTGSSSVRCPAGTDPAGASPYPEPMGRIRNVEDSESRPGAVTSVQPPPGRGRWEG